MTRAPIDLHWVQKPGSTISEIFRPTSAEQAVQLLAERPELAPVAGGTDLLLELARDERAGDASLLDLSRIGSFRKLEFDNPAHISIGAAVTHADILASADAHSLLLPLAQACLEVGSPQLRNRATIAGNLITASPANDTISALLALGASISMLSIQHSETVRRVVALEEFYSGFRETVLMPAEVVDEILVPQPTANQRGIWVKSGLRKAQAISVVHAGFVLDFDDDDIVIGARIALGSVGPTVELSDPAADVLIGATLTPTTIAAAASAAADSVVPIDDGRATADYRSDAIVTVVARALAALAEGQERDRWPKRVPLLSTRSAIERHRIDHVDGVVAHVASTDPIVVEVNGAAHRTAPAGTGTLLDWLREHAGTGTKEGCAEGECGACTVRVDGDAVMSCLVPAAQADGATVTTIEGLATDAAPHPMQRSFVDKFAVQCGFCIPGFVMAAETLAAELETLPTRDELELALSGNLCRCTGYYNIIDAVLTAMGSAT